jgi:hypothetical protein
MVVANPQLDTLESSARVARVYEAKGGPLGLVPVRPAVDDLEIALGVNAAWNTLALSLRRRVATLFDRPCAVAVCSYEIEGPMPEDFARDLAWGGFRFRAAFPTLRRRVVAIVATPSHTFVRIACQGEHVAPFFDLLAPTKRSVQFDVTHRLVIAGDDRIEDRIALDLRAIVLQLAGSSARPSTVHPIDPFDNESYDQPCMATWTTSASRSARRQMAASSAAGM